MLGFLLGFLLGVVGVLLGFCWGVSLWFYFVLLDSLGVLLEMFGRSMEFLRCVIGVLLGMLESCDIRGSLGTIPWDFPMAFAYAELLG